MRASNRNIGKISFLCEVFFTREPFHRFMTTGTILSPFLGHVSLSKILPILWILVSRPLRLLDFVCKWGYDNGFISLPVCCVLVFFPLFAHGDISNNMRFAPRITHFACSMWSAQYLHSLGVWTSDPLPTQWTHERATWPVTYDWGQWPMIEAKVVAYENCVSAQPVHV